MAAKLREPGSQRCDGGSHFISLSGPAPSRPSARKRISNVRHSRRPRASPGGAGEANGGNDAAPVGGTSGGSEPKRRDGRESAAKAASCWSALNRPCARNSCRVNQCENCKATLLWIAWTSSRDYAARL